MSLEVPLASIYVAPAPGLLASLGIIHCSQSTKPKCFEASAQYNPVSLRYVGVETPDAIFLDIRLRKSMQHEQFFCGSYIGNYSIVIRPSAIH
jgi:hypothetical protein